MLPSAGLPLSPCSPGVPVRWPRRAGAPQVLCPWHRRESRTHFSLCCCLFGAAVLRVMKAQSPSAPL